MLITAALTLLFLPLVVVIAWPCWNLRPVPAIRIWSVSFGAMALAMLLQSARADFWRSKFELLTLQLQSQPQKCQQCQRPAPNSGCVFLKQSILDVACHCAFPVGEIGFRYVEGQFDPRMALLVLKTPNGSNETALGSADDDVLPEFRARERKSLRWCEYLPSLAGTYLGQQSPQHGHFIGFGLELPYSSWPNITGFHMTYIV